MFKIIITGGPAEKYIATCLDSIKSQTHKGWQAYVVLDPMDNSAEIAKKYESEKISVVSNPVRYYAIQNIVTGIHMLNPGDDDIIVTIDADDWLCTNRALEIVNKYYVKGPETLMTHGSWIG